MKNWKWWAFLLVGTSLCLCAPTAIAAESAGLHTQLPGAELWQPYLDQSPVDALQVAEDPWSVLQSFALRLCSRHCGKASAVMPHCCCFCSCLP